LRSRLPPAVSVALALSVSLVYAQSPVEVSYPNTEYKDVVSPKDLDFDNFEYKLPGWINGLPLKNGSYKHADPSGFDSAQLKHVWPFDIQDGKPRHALIVPDYYYGARGVRDMK